MTTENQDFTNLLHAFQSSCIMAERAGEGSAIAEEREFFRTRILAHLRADDVVKLYEDITIKLQAACHRHKLGHAGQSTIDLVIGALDKALGERRPETCDAVAQTSWGVNISCSLPPNHKGNHQSVSEHGSHLGTWVNPLG